MKGPHQGQPVRTAGAPLTRARGAMVMLHGRGATAESILSLAQALDAPDFAYLAPQAGGNSWWPQSFLAPIESNEPGSLRVPASPPNMRPAMPGDTEAWPG